MSEFPDRGRTILDEIDYAIFGNLCIARVNGAFVVALMDGICPPNVKRRPPQIKRTS